MMRTLATKQPTNDSAMQKKKKENSARSHSVSPLSTGMPLLQRKCSCGGGCPRCQEESLLQTKLRISEPSDKYEQEADRIADEVMRMLEPSVQQQLEPKAEEQLQQQHMQKEEETLPSKPLAKQITSLVQRKAEPMEQEEEQGILQTQTTSSKAPTASSSLQNRIASLQGNGQPLSQSERTFFEPRFGTDFSQVRVHADSQAAETAQVLNSLAFTLGRDIVFGAGQYQPSASEGRRLLAHELTHILQQGVVFNNNQYRPETIPDQQRLLAHELAHKLQNHVYLGKKPELFQLSSTSDPTERQADRITKAVIQYRPAIADVSTGQPNKIQRMKIGEEKPPFWETEAGDTQLEKISEKEVAKVNAAIKLVKAVAHNQEKFRDCHEFFTENCPNGDSLKDTFDRAVLWKFPTDAEETGGAKTIPGKKEIAITYLGLRADAKTLAHYLMHELMHVCGVGGAAVHRLADKARLYCMGADPNQISLYLTKGESIAALFSYRRFLDAWILGRLKPSIGLDLNLTGATGSGGDLLSVIGGLKGRSSSLWGGGTVWRANPITRTGFGGRSL